MKFINWIKEKFSKSVKLNANDDILSLSKQSGWIKLNKKLIVPAGYICLLVAKEKVCDRFLEGEHKMSVENLPALTRQLKLNIPNKKGEYRQKFYADIYFVKLSERTNNKFCSQQGIYLKKDKQFLGTTAFVKGTYSFTVEDPILLLEALLKMYGKFNGSLAQRQIDVWTGELVDKCIQKNKPNVQKLYERDSSCFLGLIDYLNKNIKDVGLKYSTIEVTSTMLPKSVYKKAKLDFDEVVEQKPHKESEKLENAQEQIVNTQQLQTNDATQRAKIDFGSDIKTLPANDYVKPGLEKVNGDYYIDDNYTDINSNKTEAQPETLEEMQSKISYKKCKNCGAFNPKDAKVCFNCRAEFKKICEHCGEEINSGDFVCPKCKSIVI